MKIVLVPKGATAKKPAESITLTPTTVQIRTRPLRILDFDCECRPLHWIGSDYVSRELTAIAWAWIEDDQKPAHVVLLGENGMTVRGMLEQFTAAYSQADIVTGHFIRGFDLPLINSALFEHQMPLLSDKLTQDTKMDLARFTGLSKSQENMGATLGLNHPKVHMNQQRWRDANRLSPDGFDYVRERAVGDVNQHIEMRQKLLDLGYLSPAVKWQSKGDKPLPEYQP